MNLQEHIRKILKEELNESKNSNRLKILNDLVEPFSKDVGVCHIDTWYDDIDDMYLVYLVFGTKELNDWFTSRNLSTDAKFTYIKKKQKEVRDTIKSFFPIENIHVGSYGKPHCGVESLNESVPSQVRRRHGEFDRIFKHYREAFINNPYKTFNSFWNTLLEVTMETLYHAWFSKTVSDDDWEESAEYIENYLIEKYKEETKQMWNDRDSDSINESEHKKSKLLKAVEENGLLQVIQDTGLSLPQIYTKTGELPREVFERFIKEFIDKEGYHQSNGAVQLGYEVEIQTHVHIDHFYLEGDRVTLEIKGYNNHGEQTDGYIESLSNLTDNELFAIVEDMILWGIENLYYEI